MAPDASCAVRMPIVAPVGTLLLIVRLLIVIGIASLWVVCNASSAMSRPTGVKEGLASGELSPIESRCQAQLPAMRSLYFRQDGGLPGSVKDEVSPAKFWERRIS